MNGSVRPVVEKDIDQIASMHERLLGKRSDFPSSSLKNSLTSIILENPWRSPTMPSLVYEQDDGRLGGFLGVVPRPMLFNGRKITAAISHSFIVEPDGRSGLTAIKLLKTYLSGPQDLSLAEGNTVSRKIWEGMGSSTSLLLSLSWTRPLQPTQYVLAALKRRGLPAGLASPLQHLSRWIDNSVMTRRGPFKLSRPALASEELDVANFSNDLAGLCRGQSLLPDYDQASLTWLLELIEKKTGDQRLRKVLLRNDRHEIVGWYLYCRTVSGAYKVIQLVATEHYINAVLDHLFYQAREDGVVAISGYMIPKFFQALASRDCLFRHDGATAWMLFHSRDREITDAFHQGRVFVSRLDAEWWIGFLLE